MSGSYSICCLFIRTSALTNSSDRCLEVSLLAACFLSVCEWLKVLALTGSWGPARDIPTAPQKRPKSTVSPGQIRLTLSITLLNQNRGGWLFEILLFKHLLGFFRLYLCVLRVSIFVFLWIWLPVQSRIVNCKDCKGHRLLAAVISL